MRIIFVAFILCFTFFNETSGNSGEINGLDKEKRGLTASRIAQAYNLHLERQIRAATTST
jgi:hypothetical protein